MFFSSRVPSELHVNALSRLLDRLRRDGTPIIDLTESNPTRAGLAYPGNLLAALSASDNLTYHPEPFGLDLAREAISQDFARRGLDIPPAHVVLTSSTSEAYSLLFKLLCDPGDRVLVPVPSYPLFEYLTRLDAVEADRYPLRFEDRWSIDVGALRDSITPRTRAVLVVNPNNPTGSFLSASDLAAIRALCAAHDLALIGDEVFNDYAYEPARVTSVLDAGEVLTFGLGGLSKAAGLPQLKLGWIGVDGPPHEVARALERLEVICDAYLSVATPVQRAAPALLQAAGGIRAQIHERVRNNLATLAACAAAHPSTQVLPCEGGWYAVVRVPRVEGEEQLVHRLLADDHILVHPGYFFDFLHEAFLVVSLLPEPRIFHDAVSRVIAVAAAG